MITRRLSLLLATLFVLSMTFAAPVFASGVGDWNNGDDHNGCWCDDSNGNHNGDHNGDESWCDDNDDDNGNHNDGDDDWSNGNHDDDEWCDDNGNGNGDDDDDNNGDDA
jgi:hypothetical protein